MKVFWLLFLVWIMCCSLGAKAFIIPDELPSLLSVIYSNIPTIKKGTDSRIGWGFRLGDRADFQVLVELGPQTNTQPLANQQDASGNNKRNTLQNLANTLYAQRQQEKNHPEIRQRPKEQKKPATDADVKAAAAWLKNWSHSMSTAKNEQYPQLELAKAKPGLGIGEIDAKSVIPDDSELEEQQEKRKILESVAASVTATTTSSVVRSTTSKEDALDNVDLD